MKPKEYNVPALRQRIEELEAELAATQANEQRLVDANSPLLAENYALKAENQRLREVITAAPHSRQCRSHLINQGIDECDCWKSKALEETK